MSRRAVALAALVAAALSAPAAGAQVCHRVRVPSAREEALRDAVSARKDLGFRHDRAYVARLLASPAARRRGGDEGIGPVSAGEARYLRTRKRVEDAADAVADAAGQRPDIAGGLSIEDDYPRPAFLRVRVTADLEAERARLQAAAPAGVRVDVRPVRFAQRDLLALQDRVDDDDKALDDAGFRVQGTETDVRSNRVEVELDTRRGDAAQRFVERYGPAVRVHVVPPVRLELVCVSSASYAVSPSGRTLTVTVFSYADNRRVRAEHRETRGRVRVGIVEGMTTGVISAVGVTYTVRVHLHRPLGRRRVYDLRTGQALPLTTD